MDLRKQVLTQVSLGSRIAEDELDELHSYFVETEQWRKILTGDVDIVFGAKGAGKSALYSLLVAKSDELRLGRRIVCLPAENPRGTPAFRDLAKESSLSDETFRSIWKLYFLSLTANYLRGHYEHTKRTGSGAKVIDALETAGLLVPTGTLLVRLKAVLEYIRRYVPIFEGAVTDPSSGFTFTGKIALSEPTAKQREDGFVSADDLLHQLDAAFREENITPWVVLDRLDVAFAESEELEGAALRGLFRTYLDMQALAKIRLKIFLRDDIWMKIVKGGFREASHVVRSLTISWDDRSLLNLIVRRLLANSGVRELYSVSAEEVLKTGQMQEAFIDTVFPKQVDVGKSKPKTLDWMLSRTADGSKRTAPRELIHLLLEARDEQLKLYELGASAPEEGQLISKAALRAALPEVSRARYEQTLCAEHPQLLPFLSMLEREKTQQSLTSLQALWKCSPEKSVEMSDKLVEAGFFERRGTKDAPLFWVPMLYRDALDMVQGAA